MKLVKSVFRIFPIALVFLWSVTALAEVAALPDRPGPRPATTAGVPHVQIDVDAVPELMAMLLQRVEMLSGVEVRPTVVSLPGAKGFWLDESLNLVHPEVIVGGREFAHIHPDGSLHASLPPHLARAAVNAGWATHHPWSDQRSGWEGFVLIYTPQTDAELDVVFGLVQSSYEFITGRRHNAPNE